jgi:hypothetical protein
MIKAKQIIAGAGTFEESVVMTVKNFLKATGGILGIFGKKK